ncbi:MAG: S41 family peptidase [Patescibacteria group bacterium]
MVVVKITLKKIRYLVAFAVCLLAVGLIGYKIGTTRPTASISGADLSLFWLVWHRLEDKYLDRSQIDPEKMVEGAIAGMVASLEDPYTVFLPPDDNKVNKEDLTGEFGGVGIQLGFKDKTLAVLSPLDGTPAQKVGVQAGDLILKIKDEANQVDQDTQGISLPEAVKLIRGKQGTDVTLTLFRQGQAAPFEVVITRANIAVPALETRWETAGGKRFAYIHLLQFSEVMQNEWLAWVEQMKLEKSQADFGGVVLDLRNNPGGFLQGSVFTAGEFLPRGEVVVWQEDYKGKKIKFTVDRIGELTEVPLVVLINQGSASAAEILAGALRDHQRAKIVGQTSFGKGTVQEPEDLPGQAGLHVTIARWLLPNGDSIHKQGIKPDVEVDVGDGSEDLTLKKGLSILVTGE